MPKKRTIFQTLNNAMSGNWDPMPKKHVSSYDLSSNGNSIIYKTDNKQDYDAKKLELRQDQYLHDKWLRTNVDLSLTAFAGLNRIKLMYNEVDLMDSAPEIGAALDTYSEEASLANEKGMVVNVYSKSDRVKNILEDLFVNRLNVQMMAQMVIRGMCKYGNQFMLLDIDSQHGVKGWRQLPVFEVERMENGIQNPYGMQAPIVTTEDAKNKDMGTKFVWYNDRNSSVPFFNWQIAHFRLLTNSMYLPYGCSMLNSARRHWRMLSLMEDMMLIYRLERSMERRVYKVFVGAIDDADVNAYVEEVATNLKRAPIIDPMTGQVDLRKNILPVHKDTPIPLLDGRTITIEQLAEEYENGKENFVYSIQDETHTIVPGKVVWCGKNYTAEKLVKITFDDDSHAIMAGEHELLLRDGSKKRADELSVGESIMPFYREVNKTSPKKFDRYEKVYNPNTGKYEFTHRLMARYCDKLDETYNTVHHKDFNKYNNCPSNLQWMDYHEHHKMHGDLARRMWSDEEKRRHIIECLSKSRLNQAMSDTTKEKISATLKGRYAKGELDNVKEIASNNITKYNKSEEHRLKAYERGVKLGYRREFEVYNNSDLHEEHNSIRRIASSESWNGPLRDIRMSKMKVKFDEYIWNEIRNAILLNHFTTQNQIINFINENLIWYLLKINESKKLQHYQKITKPLFKARLQELGFENAKDYITSITKNHKVASLDWVDGDDVYCMTVLGLDGEEDRHNFALCTWNQDGSVEMNGVFVSNCADNDIFIPVRDANAPTPIDTLSAGQNLTAMDDIKYIQKKVLAALRIPRPFLNFDETTGDGKNLALMDIRFTRMVNRIQQAFLMELTKVATIHLYLLGFEDDLTNFTLTMNNPSTQAEQLQVETIQAKVDAIRDAVSDPGNGLQVMSLQRALKDIMKWSEKEIKENFEEIRLEKAIAAELEKTQQIIKKTGIFDTVDRIYGEPGAKYSDDMQGEGGMGDGQGGMGGGSMGGGPIGGGGGGPTDFGEDLDELGGPGAEENGSINGQEGSMPTSDITPKDDTDSGLDMTESLRARIIPLLTEEKTFSNMLNNVKGHDSNVSETKHIRAEVFDKAFMLNEEIDKMLISLEDFSKDKKDE